MAAIQNDRDALLQAAAVRVEPIPIPMANVEGLVDTITTINNNVTAATNLAKAIRITTTSMAFTRTTGGGATPSVATLTATLTGLTGTVTWAVVAGAATLTPSGNTCSVNGASVTGYSVTVQATLGTYTAQITLSKFGTLSSQDTVSLVSQVTGQLATGNITGLGALALLNTVNLNTQVTGALNGVTQVTNLGVLAYADGLAANQIGAGTLAAGVIYAGSINADNITSGTIVGRNIKTANSGARLEVLSTGQILGYGADGLPNFSLAATTGTMLLKNQSGLWPTLEIQSAGAQHIVLDAHPNFPAADGGALFRHSTHELCYSDGTHWYKISGTLIV